MVEEIKTTNNPNNNNTPNSPSRPHKTHFHSHSLLSDHLDIGLEVRNLVRSRWDRSLGVRRMRLVGRRGQVVVVHNILPAAHIPSVVLVQAGNILAVGIDLVLVQDIVGIEIRMVG